MMTRWAAALAAFLMLPAAAAAQTAPAVSVQDELAQMSDLDIATAFFMPRRPLELFVHDACTTVFRTRLATIREDIEIGREIPGIHDVMIRAMGEYCAVHVDPAIDEIETKVRTKVTAQFTPAEIRRIVGNFRFAVEEAMATEIDVREGETGAAALERGLAAAKTDEARFAQTQQALARAPGGAALLKKIAAMQSDVQAGIQPDFAALIKRAMNNARMAANDFAISNGHGPIYIVD